MTAALLFVAATACAFAQGGEVRGVVMDARGGEPVARVRIQLLGSPHQAVTGPDGRFSLSGVPEGAYMLQASTVGYRLVQKEFTLASGEVKEFEIVLNPDTLRRTESVEVRAGPFELARQDSPSELTLDAGEAKNLASVLADDPLRAVQSLPGVASNDDLNSRFSLRGAGYHRIGLYLDDVLLHAPFHMVSGEPASGSLTIFNGDLIDSLSLHSGAFPARYADRTAGILDARTREGSRQQTSVRGTASASSAGLLAEGPLGRGHRGSWLAAARKSYLHYIIARASEDPALAFGFFDSQGKITYDPAPAHQLTLNVIDGFSGLDRDRAISRLGINSVIWSDYHFTLANLGWRYTPKGRLLITNRAAYLREKFENRNRERLPLARGQYNEWVWGASATWMQAGRNPLDVGWTVRRVRDDGFVNRYQFSPFAQRRLDDYRGTGLRTGAYLQQAWLLADGRLHLSAGARWDRHSANGRQAVLPHAAVALHLLPSTRLHLGWGQYAQFPELQWLLSRFGSRRLLPERSTHYLAGLEQRMGERMRFRLEWYERQDRDLLFRPFYEPRILQGRIFNPPTSPPLANSLRGYSRGLEVFLQRRSANGLTGWVSYAFGHARLRDGQLGLSFPADQDQRHTVNIYLGYRVRPSVHLSLKWLYGSGFPLPGFLRRDGSRYFLSNQRNALRLGSYQRADIRINKAWTRDRWKVTLYGEVINFANRRNLRFDSFNGYNSRTGQAFLTLYRMAPVLPAAGVMLEF